jgi:Scaffold protein Nfu/NifU N terminal
MPHRVLEFRDTPNPNAKKLLIDPPTGPSGAPPRSFMRADQAKADPLGQRLFQVPGVVNVLIHSDWITIGKAPDMGWERIKAGVVKALAEATPA